jgi:hypothetical protein
MIDIDNQITKLSKDLLDSVRGVMEGKKTNKHGHDHVGKEDADIDNDGDTDKSDKYLHNRRKAIASSMKKEEVEVIDELSKKTLGSYAKKAKDDLVNRESKITRNRYVDPKGVKDLIKHNNSLLMKREKRRDFINTAIDKMTKEEVEGDPRVEPKDVKSKGKSLKMITGQVKESNYNGSRTKTGTEQARARFDKKMERKEMQKDQEDDN